VARLCLPLLFGVAACLSLTACGGPKRDNVLVPSGSSSALLMDFREPFALDPPPPGWYHRTFRRHPPMEMSFGRKEGRAALRLATNDSASMLFRFVDVALDRYPTLIWDWYIEHPIATDLDENTVAGDDHPARLWLGFESAGGDTHDMEIIWGNRSLGRGDWKHLTFFGLFSFPHYVANGGDQNAGLWHTERVDLRALYRELWGDPGGARLVEVALFCDTDETGAESVAWFETVRVESGGY